MRNLTHEYNQDIFSKISALFLNFEKRTGKTFILPPLVTRLLYSLFIAEKRVLIECDEWKRTFERLGYRKYKTRCLELFIMNEKTGKYMWGLQIYYKGTPAHVFSCEICKILRTPILKNIGEWLHLILKKWFLRKKSPRKLWMRKRLWKEKLMRTKFVVYWNEI